MEQLSSRKTEVRYLSEEVQATIRGYVTGLPRAIYIAADQASCGIFAMSFLQGHENLDCDLLADPPHRFWNSEKLGLLAGHAWEAVLLTSIPYSVNDGPWASAGFHQQL